MSSDESLSSAALARGVQACLDSVGGDASLIGAHDDNEVTSGRLARIGKQYVIVSMPADLAANRMHTLAVFRIGETEDERFKLDVSRALFMLTDQRPKGWRVQLMRDPAGWSDDFMSAMRSTVAAARAEAAGAHHHE